MTARGGDAAVERTAPGKLLLAGEYAVLHGAEAVVVAMDRRARAHWPRAPQAPRPASPFLDAVAAQLEARLGPDHASARAARALAVDTSAFTSGGQKLGLGSSAAATVAATATALAVGEVRASVQEIFELAAAAHGDAQGRRGTRGSGADIAASCYGGALRFRLQGGRAEISPLRISAAVTWLPFFTGQSADTVSMVAQVERCGAAARPALRAIAEAAAALADALTRDDGPAILAAVAAGGQAIAALGLAAGHDLETGAVRAARAAVSHLGVQVKTTGAGGGDLAVAAVPAEASRNEVAAALIQAGCHVLPLSIDPRGVDLGLPPV
ncbi:MAG: hypothetical protein IPI49_17235 [Myxococcales bacterium]|nr:hypothetical protein [Myxococcales bacterium]